jgi:FkbM family methyltransferase
MMSVIDKFWTGLKKDPLDTLIRSLMYVLLQVGVVLERMLFHFYRLLLFPLPGITKADLKHSITPVMKLDYPRSGIFLTVDSKLSIRRAAACKKEPETVAWIEEFIQPGDVFYDIGANVGAYSLVASKFVQDRLTVYALEPSFSTYNQLCQNIVLNHCQGNIYPFMMALNDVTGIVEFDYHSLDAGDAEHRLIDSVNGSSPVLNSVFRQRLLGYSLDDLVSSFGFLPPTHIKLDVDGSEFAVLRGASTALKQHTLRSVLVEVRREHDMAEEVEKLLKAANFKLAAMHDRGNGIIWNYIFTRN